MDVISIILLAIGLSLDDFALGLALGLAFTPPTKKERINYGLKMAFAFSISSAILPLVGWAIGLLIYQWVVTFSAWILLIVFCGVGIWILKEAFEEEQDKEKLKMKNLSSIWVLMGLGVLGSIDEGAVGIGYAFIDVSIPLLILLVVLFNTILVFIALSICNRVSRSQQKYPPIIAGLILIVLGLKNWIGILWGN
jgi:manganese efflux pump family protein